MAFSSRLRTLRSSVEGRRQSAPRRRPLLEMLENRIVPALGDSMAEAGTSAKHILDNRPGVPTGICWIDPNGGDHADAIRSERIA